MRRVAVDRHDGCSWWLPWVGLALLLTSGGCIIAGDKCDAHQVKLEDNGFALCVCEPGAAPNVNGIGCTPCGDNREVQNGLCVCKEGFAASSDGKSCVASEIGASCGADDDCSSDFPHCVTEYARPYCSSAGCNANADCPGGWTCETSASTRYCRKPVSGMGNQCTTNDNCSAFEANYCETLQTHSCILQGCAAHEVVCPNEWVCCDYTALLGSPLSTCLLPSQTVSGACPQGGKRVDR